MVRLTDEERETLRGVSKKLQGSSQQVRRAHMLLKADANGPNWPEKKMAEAFLCRTKTGENVRQRLVTVGFEIALHGEKPQPPPPKTAGWRARSAGHRVASGQASQRVRQLVVAVSGRAGRGAGHRRDGQP